MKLALFGATGRTGSRLLRRALGEDHSVKALVRDPARLEVSHPRLTFLVGDAETLRDVEATIDDTEAVLIALGAGDDGRVTTVLSSGTRNVLYAMEARGIARLVSLLSGWLFYERVPARFEAVTREHARQLAALEESPVDWIAVCPPSLTDEPGEGQYQIAIDAMPGHGQMKVSRDDVAHFMLSALERDDVVRKRIGIADVRALVD